MSHAGGPGAVHVARTHHRGWNAGTPAEEEGLVLASDPHTDVPADAAVHGEDPLARRGNAGTSNRGTREMFSSLGDPATRAPI